MKVIIIAIMSMISVMAYANNGNVNLRNDILGCYDCCDFDKLFKDKQQLQACKIPTDNLQIIGKIKRADRSRF